MIKEKLKKLASEFLQAQLWEDLTDSDVFGVELKDERIAYCCVMGNSGIHKGLGIYVGKRGFRSYLDTVNKEHADDRKPRRRSLAVTTRAPAEVERNTRTVAEEEINKQELGGASSFARS